MMKYGERDLREVDLFSLALVGIGMLLLVLGALTPGPVMKAADVRTKGKTLGASETVATAEAQPAQPAQLDAVREVKKADTDAQAVAAPRLPVNPAMILLGIVFLCLGAAMNLQLKRVIANKGEDVPAAYVGIQK